MIAPLLLVVALASQPKTATPQQVGKGGSRQANATEPSSAAQSLSVTVTMPPPDPKQLEREAQQRERELSIQERVATFTIVLAFVGVLQIVVTLFGFIWTRTAANAARDSANAARESVRASNANAYAARDSADFTNAQNAIMKRQSVIMRAQATTATAMHLAARAWVGPIKVKGERFQGSMIVKVVFTNTGNTPALRTASKIGVTFDPAAINTKLDRPINGGVLMPRGIMNTSTADQPLTAAGVEALRTKKAVMFVYGRIWYDDVFGRTHWTTFAFHSSPDLTAFGPVENHSGTDDDEQEKG